MSICEEAFPVGCLIRAKMHLLKSGRGGIDEGELFMMVRWDNLNPAENKGAIGFGDEFSWTPFVLHNGTVKELLRSTERLWMNSFFEKV